MLTGIIHDRQASRFTLSEAGLTAYVEYSVHDGKLDILHTIVPEALSGRGIAAALVKEAYAYAASEGLAPAATCPYAVKWMKKNMKA